MMKTKILLLCACLCACMFTQCSHSDDDLETGTDVENEPVVEETGTDVENEPVVEESPIFIEPGSPVEEDYKLIEAGYYHIWKDEDAECLPQAKTGRAIDITGKWQLITEVSGDRETDRSCENIVWHFAKDRTLTVSVNGENGTESEYKYGVYPFGPICMLPEDAPVPNLKMESSEVYCDVLFEIMVMYPQLREGTTLPSPEVKLFFLRIE